MKLVNVANLRKQPKSKFERKLRISDHSIYNLFNINVFSSWINDLTNTGLAEKELDHLEQNLVGSIARFNELLIEHIQKPFFEHGTHSKMFIFRVSNFNKLNLKICKQSQIVLKLICLLLKPSKKVKNRNGKNL